ncbi:hypothetical protein A3746_03655 [Oleibacter sp. HI0075]|nr:hypothetical protein A3746_03655 [Oleibacter sp. HI0075]
MVPEGWKHRRLSEICTTVTSGSRDWAQYYADDGAKFIRMTNLRRESIWLDLSDLKFVDIQRDSADGKRTSLRAGDILMSITAELGKIGWVNEGLGESYINQHTALIRLNKEKASTMFVAYLLSSQEMNAKINRLNDSGAKAGLNLPTIRAIPLSLPPLPEQKKIAQILSTWDKAITTTEQLLANSQQQKKALMQQLLTGKKRLLDKNGVRFSGEWQVLPLGHLTNIFDGTHSTPKYVEDGVPFYSVEHLTANDFSKTKFISEEVFDKENKRVKLERGDILMTRIGDIGTAKHLDWDVRASFYVSLALVKASESFDSEYMTQYINSNIFRSELWKRTIHVAFPKKINLGEISNCLVVIPSLEEQQKIAAVLSTADQEISAIQQKLDALKQEKKALMQQLLTGKRRVKPIK